MQAHLRWCTLAPLKNGGVGSQAGQAPARGQALACMHSPISCLLHSCPPAVRMHAFASLHALHGSDTSSAILPALRLVYDQLIDLSCRAHQSDSAPIDSSCRGLIKGSLCNSSWFPLAKCCKAQPRWCHAESNSSRIVESRAPHSHKAAGMWSPVRHAGTNRCHAHPRANHLLVDCSADFACLCLQIRQC